MRLLLIDNYDSFTHNLSHLLTICKFQVDVVRSNDVDLIDQLLSGYDAICISPGPGSPADARISCQVIEKSAPDMPILGICLGMQIMAHVFGGSVVTSGFPVHGETEAINHQNLALFQGISQGTKVARYHSLIVSDSGPEFRVDSKSESGLIMAMSHISRPLYGLQFHPESFMTENGGQMVANFYRLVSRMQDGRAQ